MAISNREQIARALTLLGQGLYPYVEKEMQAVHREGWLTAAKTCLRDDPTSKRDIADILREDVSALLNVISKQWDRVFKKNTNLGHAERALVSELIEVRNRWAHQQQSPFSAEDTYRALDSIARLLKAVSAPEADTVEKEKQKALRILLDPTRSEHRTPSAEDSRLRQELAELLKKLPFQDASRLTCALTHRSYLYENPKEVSEDNELLEFLGDALLTFLSGEYLYRRAPKSEEGELTRLRSALVDKPQLAKFATELDIGKWMRLGRGELAGGGSAKSSLLSNTFEAIVGAYFLDSGIEAVRDFVEPLFNSVVEDLISAQPTPQQKILVDSKNQLQEWVQATIGPTPPKYVTVQSGGFDHAPEFLAKVFVGEKQYGEATGRSKKDAEKRAAEDALSRLKRQGLM